MDKPFLPPSQIKLIAEKQLQGKTAQRIYYGEKNKAAYVLFSGKGVLYYALPGRIAVFFAALIVASLPITGFYIWWGRKKKKATKNFAVVPAKELETALMN